MSFSMLVKWSSGNIFRACIIFHGRYAPQGCFVNRRRITLDGWFKMQGRMMSKENAKPRYKPEEIFAIYKFV